MEPKLRRAMRKLGADSALEYTRGGIGRVEVIAVADYRQAVREILFDLYERTAEGMNDLVRDSAKSFGIPLEEKQEDSFMENMLEWFGALALEQSKTISNSMKEEVVKAIEPLVAEGAGEREIGREIRRHVEGIAPWKANMIARTETLLATSHAQDEVIREMDLPPMAKEWDSSRDSRTRRAHRGVEPVFMEEKFSVGRDQMRYPGDRTAHVSNLANCRCVVNYAPADQIQELRDEVQERVRDIEEDEAFERENQ